MVALAFNLGCSLLRTPALPRLHSLAEEILRLTTCSGTNHKYHKAHHVQLRIWRMRLRRTVCLKLVFLHSYHCSSRLLRCFLCEGWRTTENNVHMFIYVGPFTTTNPQLLKQPRLKTVCKEKSTGIGSRCRAAWSSLVDSCHVGTSYVAPVISLSVWASETKQWWSCRGETRHVSIQSFYNPHRHLLKNQCATESFGEEMRLEEDTSQQMKVTKKTKAPWIVLSILQGMCYKKDILCWQLLLGQFLVTLSTKKSVKTVFNDSF